MLQKVFKGEIELEKLSTYLVLQDSKRIKLEDPLVQPMEK